MCASYRNGKVVDLCATQYMMVAMDYLQSMTDRGFEVEVLGTAIPQMFLTINNEENVECKSVESDWCIRVKCLENGKEYDTVRACSVDVGVSAFRIRRVLDTNLNANGLHFVRVAKQ